MRPEARQPIKRQAVNMTATTGRGFIRQRAAGAVMLRTSLFFKIEPNRPLAASPSERKSMAVTLIMGAKSRTVTRLPAM